MSEDNNEHHSLSLQGLKILGIFVILICGLLGPTCPVVFAYFARDAKDQRRIQKVIKVLTCLSIGIILATAMVHMLHEGINQLAESGKYPFASGDDKNKAVVVNCSTTTTTTTLAPGQNESKQGDADDDDDDDDGYPFGMIFAMAGIGVVYIFSTELNWYGMKKLKELEGIACDEEEEQRQGSLIKLYLLEIGVAVHSVIVGVALGISKSYSAATTLFVVLCVHQFFEGLAIGSLCVMAHVTFKQALGFIGTFALTTPLGIIIGIGVEGDADILTQGILSCVAAGILLQMALTEMLPSVLGAHAHHAHGPLPLAEIADHLHSHSHSHSHGHHHHHHHDEKEVLNGTHDNQTGYGSFGGSPKNNVNGVPTAITSAGSGASGSGGAAHNNNNVKDGDESQHGERMRTSRKMSNDDDDFDDGRASVTSKESRKSLIVGKGALRASKKAREEEVGDHYHNGNRLLDSQHHLEDTRASQAVSDYVDDHEDDESLGFRIVCYFAFFVGISIQAILGIWA